MHLLTPCCYEYLYECIHPVSSFYTYTNAFFMYHHTALVNKFAFAIPYTIFMHLGSTEEITLLEINEGEEGDQ